MRQAFTNAYITKKMDPKKQTKELAEAIIKSIRMFGDAAILDPKKAESDEFLDQYEDLWARFQKLGNNLQVEARQQVLFLLQKNAQDDDFYYTKCYSNLQYGGLGYI